MINPIKNMKILFKIMLIIVNIVIFMVILSITMNIGLNSQKKLIEEIADSRFAFYKQSVDLLTNVLQLDYEFNLLMMKNGNNVSQAQGNSFKTIVQQRLDPQIADLEKLVKLPNISQTEKTHFENALPVLIEYRRNLIYVSTAGQIGTLLTALVQQVEQAAASIKTITQNLRTYEETRVAEIKMASLEQIKNQISFFYIICVISIIIPLVISFFIARGIVVPIKYLVDYSQLIAKGDLRKECNIQSRDEVGNLSLYINKIVMYVKDFILNIKQIQNQNFELKNKLVTDTTETLAAVTEISSNLNSSMSMLNNLNRNVESSVEASDDISRIVEVFREQIENQTASVNESSASIEQIIRSIKSVADLSDHRSKKALDLLSITEVGIHKIGESNQKIQEISAITDNMLEAVDFIKDIAEQTNLLSINSAIEAAHAGAAGKSFAVVSDEIRKLADSSTESSKLISSNLRKNVEMIKSISKASSEAAQYFQTIGDEVKQVVHTLEEISNAMQGLAASGNEISLAISNLKMITGDVHSNSANIEDKIQFIKSTISTVDDVTSEVVNAIMEINTGAKQINMAMSELNENAVLMEQSMQETSKRVDKFMT